MRAFSSGKKIARTHLFAGLGLVLALACGGPVQAAAVKYTADTTKVKGHKITIFSKPTDDSGALRIVSGPGGALWFGEGSLGTIVKFSTK